ncbi:MAG TPA: ribonuclease H-like domain-containing protein [Bryobacteraceae bacterium]|jgi:hypothetical protein
MLDSNEQLRLLRQRIAAIDARYSGASRIRGPRPAPVPLLSVRCLIEQWSEGQVVANEFGEYFQTNREFRAHKQHGSADIGALAELSEDHLSVFGDCEIPATPAARWAFLDTETTGLLGVPATYAFLIGVGRISEDGFRVRQFFMREYEEERSVLAALEAHLNEFDVVITYNGKSYDQPLLEARYRAMRRGSPFLRLRHFDLLHGARRLWKLRLESCRLIQLEQEILGFYRDGDLPGELIPYVYFEYLRSHEARRLVPIFHHNAMDIMTLACLTAIVPAAFRGTNPESLSRLGVRRGEDLFSIARWLLKAGQEEQALDLFRRAVDADLPDKLLFRALWDMALLQKKLQGPHLALRAFTELAACRNEYRVRALQELAKHYEHEGRDFAMALDFTRQALRFSESPSLSRRKERLERRLSKPRAKEA